MHAGKLTIRTWFRGQDGIGHIVRPEDHVLGVFAFCGVQKQEGKRAHMLAL